MVWFVYLQGHSGCCFGSGLQGDQSESKNAITSQRRGDRGLGVAAMEMKKGARIPDMC